MRARVTEKTFDGRELLAREVAAGAVIHLDGAGLVVAGEQSPFVLEDPGARGPFQRGYNAEGRAILAYLQTTPDCPEAERARQILWARVTEYIERLSRGVADAHERIAAAPATIYEAETEVSLVWVAARTDAAAAAKFPESLRVLRRAWKAYLEAKETP